MSSKLWVPLHAIPSISATGVKFQESEQLTDPKSAQSLAHSFHHWVFTVGGCKVCPGQSGEKKHLLNQEARQPPAVWGASDPQWG